MPSAWSTACIAAICSSGATGEREKNHSPALLTPVRQPDGSEGAAWTADCGLGAGSLGGRWGWAGGGACLRGRAAVVKLDGGLACDHDRPRVLGAEALRYTYLVHADRYDPVCGERRHAQFRACRVLAVACCAGCAFAVSLQPGSKRAGVHGPAKELGRKQGATASLDGSSGSTARAQSVMLSAFWFGPLTRPSLP